MAWSWSHSSEAYQNAFENLHDLPLKDLRIIYAEWQSWNGVESFSSDMDIKKHNKALKNCIRFNFTQETLANDIYEKMQEQATCDNGGFNAYACPFG